jgi:hypothetical protein
MVYAQRHAHIRACSDQVRDGMTLEYGEERAKRLAQG